MTCANRVLALCSLSSNHGSTNSKSYESVIHLDIIAASKLTPMTILWNDEELRLSVEVVEMKSFIRPSHHGMCLGVLQLDEDLTTSK